MNIFRLIDFLTVLILGSVLLISLTGCADSSLEFTSFEEAEHGHLIPAHKPASLAEALQVIEQRQPQTGTATEEESQELKEILDWLPELTAQTDLNKQDWDRVHQISQILQSDYRKARSNQQTWKLPPEWNELRILSQKALAEESNSR